MKKLSALLVFGSILLVGCAEEAEVSAAPPAKPPAAKEGEPEAAAKEPQLSVNPDYKGG